MTGDRDVIVVNEQLDVQLLSNSQTSGFRVIAFHLRSIGAQHEDNLPWIRNGYTIDEWPHMPKAARGEFDSRSKSAFGMSRQMGQVFAVVIELFDWKIAFQSCHEILSRYAMTSFVEEDRQYRRLSARF